MALPRRCYAYTPTDQVSDWKLRMCGDDGKFSAAFIGAASAALSPGGFRGNQVNIPAAAKAGVIGKLRTAWRSVNPGKKDSEMPAGIKP